MPSLFNCDLFVVPVLESCSVVDLNVSKISMKNRPDAG